MGVRIRGEAIATGSRQTTFDFWVDVQKNKHLRPPHFLERDVIFLGFKANQHRLPLRDRVVLVGVYLTRRRAAHAHWGSAPKDNTPTISVVPLASSCVGAFSESLSAVTRLQANHMNTAIATRWERRRGRLRKLRKLSLRPCRQTVSDKSNE